MSFGFMMGHETSTQTSVISPTRSMPSEAVQNTIDHSNDNDHQTSNGNGCNQINNNECGNKSKNDSDKASMKPKSPQRLLSGLLSFVESVVVALYKSFDIGLHTGLALSFLAIVVVMLLGSFHDRYWLTILNRARRNDADLQTEITYYERRCDMTDVTTSKTHHIHFGLHNDTVSEIFIDVDKIQNEERARGNDDDGDSDLDGPEVFYDDRGFRTTAQQKERKQRRRRRFLPSYQIWETPKLKPIPKTVAEKAGKQAVSAMMKHGTVMIPQMLSDATMVGLREFINQKNDKVIGTPDEYPMTAKHNRVSYGIESTEHPSVVRALKEIHDHAVFANLIQTLVGDENPALSEITAITAWFGAEHQGWHPDVKPHGNGVKFGRTYSHSYSLFLPLQDTTGEMGATQLCPGTHMCASEEMHKICDANSIGFHEVRKARPRDEYSLDEDGYHRYKEDMDMEGIWRAGDGALLNQQGWHRGTAHEEEGQKDRIVFIVSFLKRPHADDPRQLARGTYFHQKWLNWGSTWDDMTDTMANLQRPWNILRCLHLYKPSDRSWGYDLFTATTLRIANNQMGGESDDLDGIIDNVMEPLRYPEWLQGTLDYESEEAWQIYMKGTIQKTYRFLYHTNKNGHIGLVAFLLIASILGSLYNKLFGRTTEHSSNGASGASTSIPSSVGRAVKTGVVRLLLTHGTILALGLYVWQIVICSSQWAMDIDSGKTLMKPFPNPMYRDEEPGVLGMNSTLPGRADVLIGTRMNTKAIGAYNTWFQYHPGNRVFDQFVETYGGKGGFYTSLLPKDTENEHQTASGLPQGFSDRLVASAFDMVTKHHGGGRFVMQDYRTGDWMVLSDAESRDYIKRSLLIGGKNGSTLSVLKEEVDLLLDQQRFGFQRKALSMSWISQLFLHDLSKEVFSTKFERDTRTNTKQTATATTKITDLQTALPPSGSIGLPKSGYRLPKWEPIGPSVSGARDSDGNRRFLIGKSRSSFRPGQQVSVILVEDNIIFRFRGTIVSIPHNRRFRDGHCRYKIALEEDGVLEYGDVALEYVKRSLIESRDPISSGDRVSAVPVEGGQIHDGTVLLVLADGSIDVKFDDGEVALNIRDDQYEVLQEEVFENDLYNDNISLKDTELGLHRVMAQLIPGGNYYDGKISRIHPDGSIDVNFDDGDHRFGIPYDQYELLKDALSFKKDLKDKVVSKGDRVSAQVAREGEFFDGEILLVRADGSIDVKFDDGDLNRNIPLNRYKVLEDQLLTDQDFNHKNSEDEGDDYDPNILKDQFLKDPNMLKDQILKDQLLQDQLLQDEDFEYEDSGFEDFETDPEVDGDDYGDFHTDQEDEDKGFEDFQTDQEDEDDDYQLSEDEDFEDEGDNYEDFEVDQEDEDDDYEEFQVGQEDEKDLNDQLMGNEDFDVDEDEDFNDDDFDDDDDEYGEEYEDFESGDGDNEG